MGTMDARLELRVDSLTLRRLEQRAAARHTTVASLVREGISRLLDEGEAGWRSSAVARAVGLKTPVPADPRELARLLDETYGTG
ncbi:MAG: hypothetical protein ACYC6T_05775 [Thermoleophilia bacterium]